MTEGSPAAPPPPSSDRETLGIFGAGSFGLSVARRLAAEGRRVILFSREPAAVLALLSRDAGDAVRGLHVTGDVSELAGHSRVLLLAVPGSRLRAALELLAAVVDGHHIVIHSLGALLYPEPGRATKTGCERVSELVRALTPVRKIGVLAGPLLSGDLTAGRPCGAVVASSFDEVVEVGRDLLSVPPWLRIYRSRDLVGVELAAALSGAMTVAVGLSEGLRLGPGPQGSLITRAVAEMVRLGRAMGASDGAFSGMAGLGNLIVRSSAGSSGYSDEYRLGFALATGAPTAKESEGARAALAGARLGRLLAVSTPILSMLESLLTGTPVAQAVDRLLANAADEE